MKVIAWMTLAAGLLVASPAAFADDWIVSVNSNYFDPGEVFIAPGDRVIWDWVSGVHDTVSDDGLWQSDISAPPFDFDYTFSDPGDYYYYCSIHGGPGGEGMAGIVHVLDMGP